MRLRMYNLAAEESNQFVQMLKNPLDLPLSSKEQAVGDNDLGAQ